MENTINQIKSAIGGISGVLVAAIGLLIVASVVFGQGASMNVIGNIKDLVDTFIGSGASLSSIVTLIIVLSVLNK
ncbi:MAG TPA: hypothetical protein DEA16_05620 [Opitutae bacterium]|jgi:hypothetical protein|nr:hypothetical protein [Opitutae bacterium]HBR67603.1 hypothetical protein [Opitutae bacterium]